MNPADYDYHLRDDERSAHGLGWEYHRRGRSNAANPFPSGSFRWLEFEDGWKQFVDKKLKESRL